MAAQMPKGVQDKPFFVRQAGLVYGEEGKGAITGYEEKEQADTNCAERNNKAKAMGIDARYEVVAN